MLKQTRCLHELWITFKQLWGLRQRWWKWPVLTLPQSVSFWKLRQIRGNKESIPKTLPKAQRTRGLSSSCQSHFASSTRNLNQTSASPLHFKFKILTQPSFRISTKIQLHNLYKISAAKRWTSSSFKILPELQLQNLDQPLCSKSEKSLVLGQNVSS